MTRLTLHWHLRAIADGVPSEAYTTSSGKYHPADGRACDAYPEGLAWAALRSEDAVAFLDAVAHDPSRPLDWRNAASDLLGTHIMERRLICSDERRSALDEADRELHAAFVEARHDGELPKESMQPGFWWPVTCPSPDCSEGEVLYDWDADEPRCHCGTTVPIPEYPA